MARVRVTSEIGPLRAVLVHTPGPELLAVTPGNREAYLYDDIIDLELAQQEHRRFVAVLERFAQVYEVRALLTELVGRPDVREFLVTRALEVVPSDAWPGSWPSSRRRRSSASWSRAHARRQAPLPARSTRAATRSRRSPICSSRATSAS